LDLRVKILKNETTLSIITINYNNAAGLKTVEFSFKSNIQWVEYIVIDGVLTGVMNIWKAKIEKFRF
jgi:hypothetical protein